MFSKDWKTMFVIWSIHYFSYQINKDFYIKEKFLGLQNFIYISLKIVWPVVEKCICPSWGQALMLVYIKALWSCRVPDPGWGSLDPDFSRGSDPVFLSSLSIFDDKDLVTLSLLRLVNWY